MVEHSYGSEIVSKCHPRQYQVVQENCSFVLPVIHNNRAYSCSAYRCCQTVDHGSSKGQSCHLIRAVFNVHNTEQLSVYVPWKGKKSTANDRYCNNWTTVPYTTVQNRSCPLRGFKLLLNFLIRRQNVCTLNKTTTRGQKQKSPLYEGIYIGKTNPLAP